MDDIDGEDQRKYERKKQLVAEYKNELKEIADIVTKRLAHNQYKFARDKLLECIKGLESVDTTYRLKMEKEYVESVEKTEYFSTTDDLLNALEQCKNANIVVYMESAGKYMICKSYDDYHKFIQNVNNAVKHGTDDINERQYQIVLKNKNQKRNVVFMIKNMLNEEQLKYFIKNKLGYDSHICENPKWDKGSNQLTIDYTIDSEDREKIFYADFVTAINREFSLTVLPTPDEQYSEFKFMLLKISSELVELRKKCVTNAVNIVGNQNIVHMGAGPINVAQNAAQPPPKTASELTEEWIQTNPPQPNMGVGVYYRQYLNSVKKRVNNSIFPKLVEKMGYEKYSVNHSWFWKIKTGEI